MSNQHFSKKEGVYKRRLELRIHDSQTGQVHEAVIRETPSYFRDKSAEIRCHMHDTLDVILDRIFSGNQDML